MLLKQLLLLLYAAVCLCRQDGYIFYAPSFQQKNTTVKEINQPTDIPEWITLTSYTQADVFYGTNVIDNPSVYKITNLGKSDETQTVVVTYKGSVLKMLSTYIADLPLFVLHSFCMTWLDPSIPQVQRWVGTGCADIEANAIDHTDYDANRLGNNTGAFRDVTMSTTFVYVLSRAEITIIHVMSVEGSVTHKHTLDGHERTGIDEIEYGEGYLYFSNPKDTYVIERVAEGLLNTPPASDANLVVAIEQLFTPTPSPSDSPTSFPVGPFATAQLPEIVEMRYFQNNYMFLLGEIRYESRPGNHRPASLIRILDLEAREVHRICMNPNDWIIYSNLNNNRTCASRIPDSPNFYLLNYKPAYVNLYVYSKVQTSFFERLVPQNLQINYGTEGDGFTPAPSTTIPPATVPTPVPLTAPAVTPAVNPAVTPAVNPAVTPAVNPAATPTVNPAVTPAVNPAVTPAVNPPATPTVNPAVTPAVNPAVTPAASLETQAGTARTEAVQLTDKPSGVTGDNAAVTGSSWSGLIYGALVTALLLVAGDGAFI